jgi:antitoxin (DNA-binding transcriptional repressor) of toxin-antitoxin stability system
VKVMTIRDLRQRWPQAEAALQIENEIIITRDSKPVAKLVRITAAENRPKRWDPEAHLRWLKRTWRGKQVGLVDKYLQGDRDNTPQ